MKGANNSMILDSKKPAHVKHEEFSSNPDGATAIRGRELKKAKLVCALRERGVA